MRTFIFLIITIVISSTSFAQLIRTVSGSVVDSTKNPIGDVSVNLKSSTENLTTKTNGAGKYHFINVASSEFVITVTIIGFQNYVQAYKVGNSQGKAFIIDPIKLKEKTNELAEVVITANPITIKEDTIEYRANAYKVRDGAPVEDVLKKLPGVTVDKDGVVTAQGKEVKRVRVNGKDYFGGDVQTATQNLPADIIENIQIIDDYGDRANQTGIKEGDPEKILNINIQRGKNKGSFGNATVGAGNEGRYIARVSANNFKEDRQISLLGSLNNTNANTFNFNGGGRGGGARGANFGSAERGGSGGDGTTYSSSFGLNYRDSWGKKITSYGSYSFSSRKNNTVGTSFVQDLSPLKTRTTSSANDNNNKSENHRVTWNLEYKMDSANYLKVTPYFSYSSSNGNNNGLSNITALRNGITYYTLNKSASQSNSTSPAGGSDLFYIHRFKQKGRSFSVSGTINNSSRLQDSYPYNTYHDSSSISLIATDSLRNQFIATNTNNTTTNVRFSYAEPIGKYTALEASYTWNNSTTKSIRDVNDIDGITGLNTKNIKLSNDYKYRFITNRYGLSLHHFKTKYNFLLGIVAQPSSLTGMDNGREITTQNTSFNIVPTARFAYNFSRSHSLTVNYGGASREPSFNQLQPVSDSSNLKNIITGNPNLKSEFTNRFSLQYNKVGVLTGTSLFTNISFDETQNKIVSSRLNNFFGTGRSTTYLNTNGFYGINGNMSITQPFAKKKLTGTISASGSYDNNISFTDNQKNNGYNWTIRPGARLRIDFPDIIDVNLNGSYTYNKNVTRYDTSTQTSEVKTLNFGIEGKNYFLKDWTFGYDLNKTINTGFISTVNTNPTILNLYLERRFLTGNKGTFRLQGYDLFNQNTGISRTINGDIITDRQNNRLGRYFLLTFNLRLQKFTGSKPYQRIPGQKNGNRDGNRSPRNGGFGGGGNRGSRGNN
ncbi:MAG TPA: outer membrane beta-barrel protein [Chitinophagaceae bacterium]